jgi:hypothetical protein
MSYLVRSIPPPLMNLLHYDHMPSVIFMLFTFLNICSRNLNVGKMAGRSSVLAYTKVFTPSLPNALLRNEFVAGRDWKLKTGRGVKWLLGYCKCIESNQQAVVNVNFEGF